MRIRQVRPEFFTDPVMAALSPDVRLTYIGLWLVADDAGWLRWDVPQIGALLYPFESVKRRERHLMAAAERLDSAGRLVIHECGCGQVPTLSRHQRVSGKQSFTVREAHVKHLSLTRTQPSLADSPVTERNVTERNGMSDQETEFRRRVPRPVAMGGRA